MPSFFLYVLPSGSHFATREVTIRKHPAPVYPAPLPIPANESKDDAAARVAADTTARAEAERVAADKAKPFAFVPLAANGTDKAPISRYTLDADTLAAWLAETDASKRMDILAQHEPLVTASNIAPTRAQARAMRAIADRETIAAMLANGTLVIPSDRAERAAGTNKAGAKLTEAERTAAALDALFAAE